MNRCSVLALALLSLPTAAPAEPIQSTENGHFYELVSPSGGITWSAAKDAAAAATYSGLPGHLVTLNSEAEWLFVRTTFPRNFVWIGLSDEAVEGAFQWVTDEPFAFSAWLHFEPNNAAVGPGEDWVWYENRYGQQWGWNDYRNVPLADTGPAQFPLSYVVEYGDAAPIALPEPSFVTLVLSGLLGLSLTSASRSRARPSRGCSQATQDHSSPK